MYVVAALFMATCLSFGKRIRDGFASSIVVADGGRPPARGRRSRQESQPCEFVYLVDEVEPFTPVRDEKNRAISGGREDVADQLVCGLRIKVRGRLVEDEYRSVGQQRAGKHETLPLPAESRDPFSPTSVSSPNGSESTQSASRARCIASTISCSLPMGAREARSL